jgi:hypothetical protein
LSAPDKTGRDQGGRFAKGKSGNPAGRPRGARDPRAAILAGLLDADAPLVVAKLVEIAKSGAGWAVKLVLDKVLPDYQARVAFADPLKAETAEEVQFAFGRVLQSAISGEISLSDARELCSLLEMQRRAIETGELAERLAQIEADQKRAKWQ